MTAIRGRVVSIYVAPAGGAPMEERSVVRAVPGRGLEGDRYFHGAGAFSARAAPGREITELTLIEHEVIERLQDVIPETGHEGASEALEHLLEHIIMRKQEQVDFLVRATRG